MRKMYDDLCAFPLNYVPLKRVSFVFLLAFLFGTLQLSAQTMSGSYSVCPSGCNYSTVNAAVADLKSKGVSGAVTVNISADSYNETLSFTSITGASATNTITFKGAGKYKTTISNNGTQVISITTGKYLTFKDMAIEQTGTTTTKYAVYMSGTNNNTFDNCIIKAPITTSSGYYALYANNCSNNIYTNNIISGGYYTVYNYQYSTSYAYGGDLWEGNRITQSAYYGFYNYGGYDNTYKHNFIDSAGYYNVYSYYEGSALYDGNIIPGNPGPGTATYYLMRTYYPNYYGGTGYYEFYNNMLGSDNTPAYYGHYFYTYGYSNIKYKHNTIHKPNTTGYNLYFYTSSASNNIELQNNIFTRSTSGTLLYYPYQNNTHVVDGNNYYPATGSNLIYYNLKYFTSVADYKVEANKLSHDQNATSIMPTYKSATDLHLDPTKPAPNNRYVGIDKDVDGDNRCKIFATVGADETSYGKTTIAKAGFSGPDTVIVGSPTNFFNIASVTDPNNFKYYVNGVFVEDSIHLNFVASSTGTTTIKLVTESCAGKDSFTKTIRVINPKAKPVARFIADQSIIVQGDVVRFTDISRNGASSWKWDITPDSTYDGADKVARYVFLYNTSATSQNPVVKFVNGGKYKVCLTATNSLGSNTLCRTDYISVTSAVSLVSGTQVIRDSAAYVYDNGGKDGNYSDNFKGNLLIAPCAEEIYLIFKNFDTECGYDFVRVYDGTDNTGKPLHRCTTNTNGTYGPGFAGGPSSNTCATYCVPSATDTLVAKSGKMYLEFVVDAGTVYSGFEAYYWSKPKAQPKPSASFTTADSVCMNKAAVFTNTSTGDDITYYWDLDNDLSTFEMTTKNATWPYYVTGNYTITLIAQNCGGSDTFTKEIVVYSPPTPSVAFSADNNNPTTNDIVFFSSDIKECVDDYRWSFRSATGKSSVTFVNGTTFRSENPQVVFSENGCYTVTLFAANSTGEDSLKLSCFINVKNAYCTPTVANNVTDLGISKVTINTLSNTSSQGVNDYENYVATKSTTLELGVTYTLTVERTSSQNEITRNVWIDWNGDGDFTDAGENVGQETNKLTRSWSVDIKVPTSAKTGATVMRIAVNDGSFSNAVCGQNEYGEYEDYRIYVRPDLTLPVITLLGQDTVIIEQGQKYVDAGATAMDNLDGDITNRIVKDSSKFDYLIPGTYIFSYNVADASGNNAVTVKRVVKVTPDQTAPELVVATPDTVYVAVFGNYVQPAVIKSEDLVDGGITPTIIDPVNTAVVDTFTVSYTSTDVSGNTVTVNRTVIVMDTTAPVITLKGANPVHSSVNANYVDAGVTISDNYYKNLVATVVSNVNVNRPGTYTVVYTVTDPSGNTSKSVTRTVIIEDIDKPVATLIGDTAITVEVNTVFNDPGVNATDNFDTNPAITKAGSFYQTFPNGRPTQLGRYQVVYTVTDSSGNSTSISRTIIVVDTQAPVISLIGEPSVNVCRWSTYTDAGYNVNDNYDAKNDITVTQEGSFTTSGTDIEGLFSLRYKAVDKSGNVSYSSYRSINVRNPYEFPCSTATSVGEQIGLDKLVNVYPNPNQGKFTVEANIAQTEQVRITVTNLLGQEVAVISNGALNTHTFQVDLSNQKAGVYMLNVTTSKQSVTKRIVVTK